MGFGNSGPDVTSINPNTEPVQQVGNAAGDFFSQLFQSGNPFTAGINGGGQALATQAGQNPQGQALQSLLGILGGGGAGQNVINAAQPVFEQNLQSSLGQLSNFAPGRFSTAAEQQGVGLAQNALQDFNLFQQQVLQQGQQTDIAAAQGILGPFAQMLGIGAGFGAQNPIESFIQPQGPGLGGFLGQLAGGALGSFAGPLGASAGASFFGGGPGAFTSATPVQGANFPFGSGT